MGVRVEVWPVAADESGIWLLDQEAWLSPVLPADGNPFDAVSMEIYERCPDLPVGVVHSTSWRLVEPHTILTFVAVVVACPAGCHVLDHTARAVPISRELLAEVGKPNPHHPAGEPVPRDVDVLAHALRHLRYLLDTDDGTAGALGPAWARHLETFRPALAGLYRAA